MNTRKIIFIASAGIVILIVIILFIMLSLRKSVNNEADQPTITPFPTTNDALRGPLKLVSANPANDSINAPLNTKPTMAFNMSITDFSPEVTISPTTPIVFTISGNSIVINPQENFKPATKYTLTASVGGQTFFTTFTTVGGTPTLAPDTRPVDIIDEEQTQLRNNRPDIYLSNYTPFTDSDMSITSSFQTTPTGHFRFTVEKLSNTIPQTAFSNWAKSKGLSDAQISGLDVVY